MNKLDFPSKQDAAELTLNELMQAISMAGLRVHIDGNRLQWGCKVYIALGGEVWAWRDTPRAALDGAYEEWRKRKP